MNQEELEACIRNYGKAVYSFCLHLTGNRQEGDDLYQDTFLKLVELQGKAKPQGNLKSYLLTIALNLWKNRRRKFAWRQRIAGRAVSLEGELLEDGREMPSRETAPEERIVLQEERRAVREAVEGLPEKYRLPVLLYYMEEQKIPEIARILKLPEGTVKNRLYKARKQLSKELEGMII